MRLGLLHHRAVERDQLLARHAVLPRDAGLDAAFGADQRQRLRAAGPAEASLGRVVANAARVVGLYHDGRQVGFTRAISDGHVQSYLADVYVLEEHRGRGLGVELVRFSVDEGPLAKTKWYLHTRDAHDLYRKFGFVEPSERVLERTISRDVGR